MSHSQIAAGSGRRVLITTGFRVLLEGNLELFVSLDDHGFTVIVRKFGEDAGRIISAHGISRTLI